MVVALGPTGVAVAVPVATGVVAGVTAGTLGAAVLGRGETLTIGMVAVPGVVTG